MEPAQVARSNAEDAYQAIRKLIVTVELPPGAPFTEGVLVQRVGLGKTPVREALLRLKLENLIVVQPRSGYRVAPVTLKDVHDACQLLGYLEAHAAEQAACDKGARAHLRSAQARVEHGADTDHQGTTTDGWIRADWQFHLALARGHDNQLQAEVMTKLNQLVLRFRYLAIALGVPGGTLAHHHDEILAAVEQADPAAAAAAARHTWQQIEAGLVTVLTETEPVQSANVWNGHDRNAFYLDAAPPGPAMPEVFEPRLPTNIPAQTRAETRDDPLRPS
jgi:DNA-binding GntR family transcriptional regulator